MKQAIRKQVLAKRNALTRDEILQHSAAICGEIIPYLNGTVGIYSAIDSEVNISVLRHFSSMTWAYPKTYPDHTIRFFQVDNEHQMIKSTHGIFEPKEECEVTSLDVILVPLVAFDERCNRLGHGAGYYDRYLQNFKGLTIGIAHECQKVENVFEEVHDVALDMIVTESHIYKCPKE